MESAISYQRAPSLIPTLPDMSVLTHELRSPARVTTSLLNVLSKGYVGELNEKQADLVDRARRRLQVLETLIDDLLDLAAGKADGPAEIEHHPISLNKLMEDLVERFEPLAAEKELSLKYFGPRDELMVQGDREELDRIVNNLLSNAVKYTQKGSVRVLAERSNGWARITVADTGIGIPAADQICLFQEFFRAGNAKASGETGTGLGLAIVKDLVESYGGQIMVESRENIGTCFIVMLPLFSE